MEQTLVIVKPNATARNLNGEILRRFEGSGLTLIAARLVVLNREKAEGFYLEHKGKEFYEPLVGFMTSGTVLLCVFEGDNAVKLAREIMGPTNPAEAKPGTIRHDFGESVRLNASHGSDSVKSAEREINFFFEKGDLHSRAGKK